MVFINYISFKAVGYSMFKKNNGLNPILQL